MTAERTSVADAAHAELTGLLERRADPVAGALVSLAVFDERGETAHAAVVRFSESVLTPRAARRYVGLLLVEIWLDRDEVATLAAGAAGGNAQIGDLTLPGTLSNRQAQRYEWIHDIQRDSAGWKLFWNWQGAAPSMSSMRAVGFGVPPFPSRQAAATAWLFPPDAADIGEHNHSLGHWTVWVPDDRARFVSLVWLDDVLSVRASTRCDRAQIEVQVMYGHRDEAAGEVYELAGETVEIPTAGKGSRAEVLLVRRGGEVLALTQVGRNHTAETEVAAPARDAEADIHGGENDEVELKPWVRPAADKERELRRTIAAFSNTRGGRIYVGVDDEGAVQSARELTRAFGGGSVQALAQAQAHLRRLAIEGVAPTPAFDISVVGYGGTDILCMRVECGPRQPYFLADSQDVWIRRGASNRRPTPDEYRARWERKDDDAGGGIFDVTGGIFRAT